MVVSGLGGTEGLGPWGAWLGSTEGLGPWWCQGWVVLRAWGRGGVRAGWY